MTAKDHNKLLGIFHLIQGGLQAFAGIIIGLVYGAMGMAFRANAHRPEEQMMATVFIVLAFVLAPIVLILAGVNLMAGYKLLKEKAEARTWGIVASIVSLLSIPLGTALGVYGLWFLFGEEGKRFYLSGGGQQQQNMFNTPPPPPNNWQ
jgi:cytochrome bd-type quinol oxidase subunit 2